MHQLMFTIGIPCLFLMYAITVHGALMLGVIIILLTVSSCQRFHVIKRRFVDALPNACCYFCLAKADVREKFAAASFRGLGRNTQLPPRGII